MNTPPSTSSPLHAKTSIPTLADFEDAAATLDGVIARTPFDRSQHLSDVLGVPVHLKLENLQRTGSFKIRGAAYRLSRLTAEERARGVVAASAGNHAQGVALGGEGARHRGDDLHAAGRSGAEAARDARVRRRRGARGR